MGICWVLTASNSRRGKAAYDSDWTSKDDGWSWKNTSAPAWRRKVEKWIEKTQWVEAWISWKAEVAGAGGIKIKKNPGGKCWSRTHESQGSGGRDTEDTILIDQKTWRRASTTSWKIKIKTWGGKRAIDPNWAHAEGLTRKTRSRAWTSEENWRRETPGDWNGRTKN
jgi:hypothetical protein